MERTLNKGQHTKLTLEKNILPPLLPGFELVTFRSQVRHSAGQDVSSKPVTTTTLSPYPFCPLSVSLTVCLFSHLLSVSFVPAGSPSRTGDVAVYVFDINQPSLPTPFYSVLGLFLSLWPFQLYFVPQILPATLCFLTQFFRPYFCLIGPFNYLSLYEILLQP